MLVCNVSLRPPRAAIAAELVEIGAAVDTLGSGQVVFATLVDDPASVREIVDAYLGEIMLEAASAADAADAGLVYVGGVDETTTAIAAQDGVVPGIYTGAVVETASASDAPSATIAASAAVTTTSVGGPLFVFDTTFPSSSLTVINVGR